MDTLPFFPPFLQRETTFVTLYLLPGKWSPTKRLFTLKGKTLLQQDRIWSCRSKFYFLRVGPFREGKHKYMMIYFSCKWFVLKSFPVVKWQGGEPTSRPHAYLQYQKKLMCDQIRKSATSPVFQGRFQCHMKQLACINVTDLKLFSLVYEI